MRAISNPVNLVTGACRGVSGASREAIVLLLITLQSYYFYSWGAAIGALMGYALFLVLTGVKADWQSIREWSRVRFASWICGLASIVISGFIGFYEGGSSWSAKSVIPFLMGWFSLVWMSVYPRKDAFMAAIPIVMTIHLVFFYLQLGSAFFLGPDFAWDLLGPITGEKQRILISLPGYSISAFNAHWIRPAGLFNEPSTYALYMSVLGVLWLSSNQMGRWNKWVYSFTLVSLAITGSILAWISGLLFIAFGTVILRYGSLRSFKAPYWLGIAASLLVLNLVPQLRCMALNNFRRIGTLRSDISFNTRVGNLANVPESHLTHGYEPPVKGIENTSITGEGLGNYGRIKGAGTGAGYYKNYFGIFSLPLVAYLAIFSAVPAALWILVLFLLHAPYVQHPVFWFAFALLAKEPRSQEKTQTGSAEPLH